MPPPPPLSKRRQPSQDSATTPSSSSRDAFSPLSSDDCFAEALEVDVPERGVFRVYYTPPRPKQAKRQQRQQQQQQAATAKGEEAGKPSSPGTLIFLHHGAGFSGLSFALTARAITHSTNGEVGVLALDCRGHGRTECPAPEEMSLETLTGDSFALLQTLFPDPARTPTLLLVGHSMGGGVVVSLCPAVQNWSARVAGVAVLDVVEGTAVEALSSMEGIVAMQPKGFDSMEEAIRWHVERGSAAAIRNKESARRSVPGVLKSASREPRLIFRHNLSLTTPHWRSWFVGLSQRFLGVRTARLLMLAGTDRLDKDLMVGQMQGKYQLQVLPEAGHCLMEDEPEKVAKLLVDFWRRNEAVNLPVGKGVQLRKVGQ
ncbi:protein phosphatase methylesterase [Jaminaea rosea]|uniref:Protein phosphatase methylesterase 1 n=1 Tax=Jaminaea rosea TaxID=1569628 RepID=A0A316URI7_9BASI|nr:protein phosphatase methylesterase [Jaminaea rosea]PWN27930.1 protein phosphatase methylesterase [Jaminaea rosea]